MLQILLFIIKLLVYILLIGLGILLAVLLLILLVPIRYRVHVEHGKKFELVGKVSWLLHMIHGKVIQKDGNRHITIRMFGFLIFDNQRVRKSKKAKKGAKKAKRTRRKKVRQKKANALKKRKKQTSNTSIENGEKVTNLSDTIEFIDNNFDEEFEEHGKNNCDNSDRSFHQDTITQYDKNNFTDKDMEKQKIQIDPYDSETNADINMVNNESFFKNPIKFLRSLVNFLRNKVIRFFVKLKSFFLGIIRKINSIIKRILNIKSKIDLIIEFIKNDLNKDGFRLTYRSLKRILKHILPTKLKSTLIFGTGDPCSTGQALGVLAILYSFYGGDVKITPDFENQRFEGNHYAKGRIRLATILIIVIKLILDKRFKQFTRNLITLKEAL